MAQSILEVARELIESPEAKAAYGENPDGFMAARGLDTLTADELDEAVGFVAEAMPAPVARQLVTPADPGSDQLPLARVAAAIVMEAGVADADPGTVELTALVDPSGQLDLPTDGIVAETVQAAAATPQEEETDVEEEEEEEVDTTRNAAPEGEGTAEEVGSAEESNAGFGTGSGMPEESRDTRGPQQPADEVEDVEQAEEPQPDAVESPEVHEPPESVVEPGDPALRLIEQPEEDAPDDFDAMERFGRGHGWEII